MAIAFLSYILRKIGTAGWYRAFISYILRKKGTAG